MSVGIASFIAGWFAAKAAKAAACAWWREAALCFAIAAVALAVAVVTVLR
jgi:hypothetical protein